MRVGEEKTNDASDKEVVSKEADNNTNKEKIGDTI